MEWKIVEDSPDYFLNSENGQSVLTIPFAHLFDAIMYTPGSYPVRMFAEVKNRHPEFVVVIEKGEPTGKIKITTVQMTFLFQECLKITLWYL